MDGHAACACAGTKNSSNKGSRVRTARLTLAGQVLRGLDRLLEGRAVLEREGRDRDSGRACRDGLVAAGCLRGRGAVRVLAVELFLRDPECGAERGTEGGPAAAARPTPAVHARVRALRRLACEQRPQVLRHLAVPVG